MHHSRKVPTVFFVFAVLLSLIRGMAFAQSDSGSRAEALYWQMTEIAEKQGLDAANEFFSSLPESDQAAVASAILDVTEVEESSAPALVSTGSDVGLASDGSGYCWQWTTNRLGQNGFGANLYRYYHYTYWCGGSVIPALNSYGYGETYSMWWDFSGNITSGAIAAGGVGYSWAGTFSQGRFRGTVGPAYGQTATPWMRHDVNSSGGASASGGG